MASSSPSSSCRRSTCRHRQAGRQAGRQPGQASKRAGAGITTEKALKMPVEQMTPSRQVNASGPTDK
jgi:hypothetical protein